METVLSCGVFDELLLTKQSSDMDPISLNEMILSIPIRAESADEALSLSPRVPSSETEMTEAALSHQLNSLNKQMSQIKTN